MSDKNPAPKRRMAPVVAEQMAMAHGPVDGAHSHPHSDFSGGQHEHLHQHQDGKAGHRHDHRAAVPGMTASASGVLPFGMMSFASEGDEQMPDDIPAMVNGSLTAGYMLRLGSPLGIEGSDESGWRVLEASTGSDGSLTAAAWDQSYATYQEALGQLAQRMATGDRPVLAQTWRSDMAFEDVETGDGRYIDRGGCQYRDTPLPLMLQTVTAPGHSGAILSGTIQQAGTVGMTAVGTGDFDDSDAGRQSLSIILARGRFGVSIDVAEAEGEFDCTETDDEGYCIDGVMRFSLVRIFGLTLTPFPAFEDAYIEVAANAKSAVAASGGIIHPDRGADEIVPEVEPCENCTEPDLTAPPAASAPRWTFTLMAAGGPAKPPKAWFENPLFSPNDGRMVRQEDGQYLCPLTVTGEGQVYGHFAGWRTCHTGYQSCVTAPHSRSGYRSFNERPLETAEGELVSIGPIAMGCGHIDDDGSVPVKTVKAFYDGGPGAVCAAYVHAGEDQYGGWFAGVLAEELTDRQVRKFQRLSVSGHWKEVWRGKGLDLVACAAGVFSPGFPVSAFAASGYGFDADEYRLPSPRVAFKDGRPVALVAAGVVRQPQPWERMIAAQQQQIDALRGEVEAHRMALNPLLPMSAERLMASMEPSTNGAH